MKTREVWKGGCSWAYRKEVSHRLIGSIVVNPLERHALHGRLEPWDGSGSRLKSQEGRLKEPGCTARAGVMGTVL